MVKFDLKLFLVCHIVNNMTCKIYFIQCLETNEVYIGSTKQKYLSNRISTHLKTIKHQKYIKTIR